jgi:hypothetical protein
MKLALFCNLNFTTVYINIEKYVIHQLNFICLFEFVGVERERKVHETFGGSQAINVWEPLA